MTLTELEQVILIGLEVLERQMLPEQPIACGEYEHDEQTDSQNTPVALSKTKARDNGAFC